MKTEKKKTIFGIWIAAALAVAFFAIQATAQEQLETPDLFNDTGAASTSRLSGDWPDKVPKVSVTATNTAIADVLQNITKQLGYGLVLKAPEETTEKKLTLRLIAKPAKDVLEIVLENGELNAMLKGGILFVTPAAPQPPAPTAPPAPPEPEAPPVPVAEPPFPAVVPQLPTVPQIPGFSMHAQIGDDDDDTDRGRGRDRKNIHTRITRHEKNRIQIGKPVHVKPGEEVDDAVAVGGPVTIEGKVNGDAVAVGGPLTVKKGAVVMGDAVAVGGPLEVEEGATVHGEQVGVSIPIPIASILKHAENGEIGAGLPMAVSGLAGTFAAFTFLGFLLKTVLLFVLALVVVLLAPKRVERIRGYMTDHTGHSILAGVVMLFAFVPLIILLAITIIGLPLIPVVIFALMILIVVGLAALLTWIGYKIPLFASKKTQMIALLIGVVIVMLINLIPYVGAIILFLASFAAAGAALLSKLGAEPKTSVSSPEINSPLP